MLQERLRIMMVLLSMMPFGISVPSNHMRPLGDIRKPEGPIKEFGEGTMPSPEVFWRDCVASWTPCLFRGAGKRSRAYSHWSVDYMNTSYGKTEIKREWRKEDREAGFMWPDGKRYTQPPRIRIQDYLASSQLQKDYYIVTIASDDMLADATVPPFVLCGDRRKSNKRFRERQYTSVPDWLTQMQEADLWLSTHATKSLLHYDMDQVLNCLFAGEKDWKFYDTRKHYSKFPWSEKHRKVDPNNLFSSNHVNMDVDHVDLVQSPLIADIPYTTARQHAGDCIFTPHTYSHQVNSIGDRFSAAVSYHWLKHESFGAEVCKSVPRDKYISFQDFDYVWFYNGSGVIPLGYPDSAGMRSDMRELVQSYGHGGLTENKFYKAFFKDLEGNSLGRKTKRERHALSRYHFKAFDVLPEDDRITLGEIESAALDMFVALSIATDDGEEVNFRQPYNPRPTPQSRKSFARLWELDHSHREL